MVYELSLMGDGDGGGGVVGVNVKAKEVVAAAAAAAIIVSVIYSMCGSHLKSQSMEMEFILNAYSFNFNALQYMFLYDVVRWIWSITMWEKPRLTVCIIYLPLLWIPHHSR